jgi:large subunit ribosomal protein L32
MRRSHHAVNKTNAIVNGETGEFTLSHHISPDGYYNGRQVIKPKAKVAAEENNA